MTILCSSEGRETRSFHCATHVFSPSALPQHGEETGIFGILPGSHHIIFCVESAGVLVTEHRRISVVYLVLQWCFISVRSPFLHQ